MAECPCGTGLDFTDCCEPVFNDLTVAKTAEAVMRSRYTAYVKLNYEHLKNSLHPEQRDDYDEEATKQWAESSLWEGLEIVSTEAGSENDTEGKVEFVAKFKVAGESMAHHEMATFRKNEEKWYFENGETVKAVPVRNEVKVGRNDPCPCGSGKKYKKCCGV